MNPDFSGITGIQLNIFSWEKDVMQMKLTQVREEALETTLI